MHFIIALPGPEWFGFFLFCGAVHSFEPYWARERVGVCMCHCMRPFAASSVIACTLHGIINSQSSDSSIEAWTLGIGHRRHSTHVRLTLHVVWRRIYVCGRCDANERNIIITDCRQTYSHNYIWCALCWVVYSMKRGMGELWP